MEYNTTRTHLRMPQYGRNVQSMAEHLLTIEDRELRLQNAEVVINAMSALNPQLKLTEDYRQKLWDHLHMLTEFKLDVDSPYPMPEEAEVTRRPDTMPYPGQDIKHRHLGHNLEQLIAKAKADTDPEKLQGYTQAIGYYMKLAYGTWHKDPVHDDMIRNELAQLTGGLMQYETGGYRVPFDPRPNSGQQGGNNFKNKKYKKNFNAAGSPNNINNANAPQQASGQQGGGGGNNFKKKYYKKNK